MADASAAFPAKPGQCGLALALPDGRACVDYLSRPDVYAQHHQKLLEGYLLDAIEQIDRDPASPALVEALTRAVSKMTLKRGRSAGVGTAVRAPGKGVVVSGLELDGEVVQLSAYL
jgi:hypothetical protein